MPLTKTLKKNTHQVDLPSAVCSQKDVLDWSQLGKRRWRRPSPGAAGEHSLSMEKQTPEETDKTRCCV